MSFALFINCLQGHLEGILMWMYDFLPDTAIGQWYLVCSIALLISFVWLVGLGPPPDGIFGKSGAAQKGRKGIGFHLSPTALNPKLQPNQNHTPNDWTGVPCPRAPASPACPEVRISTPRSRTICASNSGYQTPYGDMFDKRDFSLLKREAPASFDTLQRNGMLNQDGTPTEKMLSSNKHISTGMTSGYEADAEPDDEMARYEDGNDELPPSSDLFEDDSEISIPSSPTDYILNRK